MRVSTSQIFNTGTSGIQSRQYDLFKTMNQLTTGRRILTPEDDPIGASQALQVTQSQDVNKQFMGNQGTAMAKLNFLDATLGGVTDNLQSIHEKAVEASNTTLGAAERNMIATDLKQRLESLVALANTKDGTGLYIFSGYKSNNAPFQLTGATAPHSLQANTAVAYNGDGGNEMLQVSASQVMATSENGMDVFMQVRDKLGNPIQNAQGNAASMFDGIQNMIDLLDGTVPFNSADYKSALGNVTDSIAQLSTVRASVGARMQSLDSMTSMAKDADTQFSARLSDLQDLDYTEASSKLANYKMQLEAAQLSFKTISQLSLFNIL